MKGLLKGSCILMLCIVLVVSMTACGGGNEEAPDGGEEKATLVIVNWKDYGSDNPDVIAKFESENNCTIAHDYMASEEELLTKLRTGGVGKIDLVLPNPSILPMAVEEGLLEELDTTQLANYDNIFEKFKSLPEGTKDGKIFAVPWVWGSTAIAYNSDLIQEDIDSIGVLWDEKYKGKIGFRDDFNDAVMTAAILLGQDPAAPSDIEAIKAKLIEQKPLNKTYWKTGDEWSKFFANEQITVGMMWSGQAAYMKLEGQPIKYVVPKEGAIGWVDYWGIVKDSPNKDLAMKFIDYMISEEFQGDWVNSGGPAPVNEIVVNSLTEEFKQDNGISEDILSRLYFITYHTPEEKEAWNEMWQEVKAE